MTRSFITFILVTCCFTYSNAQTNHAIKYEIRHLAEAELEYNKLLSKYKAGDILVAFDIDNTLIVPDNLFVSEAWFTWQQERLNNPSQNDVIQTPAQMIQLADIFKVCEQFGPTEPSTADTIYYFLHSGSLVMALTSRGPNLKTATERTLNQIGIYFDDSQFSLPEFDGMPHISGLTDSEKEKFKLSPKLLRPVASKDNIYYSTGQNKGGILKAYLAYFNLKPKAIILVDDTEKHLDRVIDAFSNTEIAVVALRYSGADSFNDKFKEVDTSVIMNELRNYKICSEAQTLKSLD